jgi:hypothetical protein
MPRTFSARTMTAALLFASLALGAAHLTAPWLASGFELLAEPRPPEQAIKASIVISASMTIEEYPQELPPGSKIVGVPGRKRITRDTLIDISYRTPIDVNDTADIEASLSQQQTVLRVVGPPGYEHPDYGAPLSDTGPSLGPYAIPRLDWQVNLRLEGAGLEWLEQDIIIKQGTPLAVHEHWGPRAKDAGEYLLRFPLRDINRAAETQGFGSVSDDVKLTVNGVEHDVGGSDDVILPLSVWKHDMPARWLDRLTFVAAAITGLATVMVGVFGTGWGAKLIKWVGRRGRHP